MASPFTEYLGVVGRTHGTDGTVVLQDTVGIRTVLRIGGTIGIGYSREFARPFTLAGFEDNPPLLRLRLRECPTVEAARALVDQAVYIRSEDLVAEQDGRFAIGDIEGCRVVTDDGLELGTVSEVWLLPANDVWIVTRPDGSTVPVPVVDSIVRSVDVEHRIITIHLLDGLVDVDTPSSPEDHDE